MEEDAGKSIHDRYAGATAIDLNRSGVPLIEIVSEPDIRTSTAAGAYLRTLKQILQYLDVSDVSMEEGSLRVDANVSARLRGETKLGTKTEVKNMNSFSAVERALDLEFERQCGVLFSGGTIEQQTLLWDGAKGAVARTDLGSQPHDFRELDVSRPEIAVRECRGARLKGCIRSGDRLSGHRTGLRQRSRRGLGGEGSSGCDPQQGNGRSEAERVHLQSEL